MEQRSTQAVASGAPVPEPHQVRLPAQLLAEALNEHVSSPSLLMIGGTARPARLAPSLGGGRECGCVCVGGVVGDSRGKIEGRAAARLPTWHDEAGPAPSPTPLCPGLPAPSRLAAAAAGAPCRQRCLPDGRPRGRRAPLPARAVGGGVCGRRQRGGAGRGGRVPGGCAAQPGGGGPAKPGMRAALRGSLAPMR